MAERSKLQSFLNDPVAQRRVHGVCTIVWFFLAIPICIFLANSVPVVVWLSTYAIVIGHFSSWQAARSEIKADDDLPNDA